ncbi:MAG: VPLPA-CTERM sorting domain-containing protein [Gammaproteobacteria bacterium]
MKIMNTGKVSFKQFSISAALKRSAATVTFAALATMGALGAREASALTIGPPPQNFFLTIDWNQPHPNDTLTANVWTYFDTSNGATTGGFRDIVSGGPQVISIPNSSHQYGFQLKSYSLFGVYDNYDSSHTLLGQSVWVGGANGGTGLVGQTFESAFAGYLAKNSSYNEANTVAALMAGSSSTEFLDFQDFIRSNSTFQALVDKGVYQPGTKLTLVHFGSGVAMGTGFVSTTVPVPAALWLFGSGLLGLVGMARRSSAIA